MMNAAWANLEITRNRSGCMAIIYNFLDYKEPKRRVKNLLILGWVCAIFSILVFPWYKLILIFGLCALGIGVFSNLKCSQSGIRLIAGSTFIMLIALLGNFLVNEFIRTIIGVFFLMG